MITTLILINLENYSLNSFKEELLMNNSKQRILKDELIFVFRILSENGVENLQEFLIFLKTPKKAA